MMTDCAVAWIHESLPDYLHGTLSQRERLLVQAHLALCEGCSSELALLERCQAAMMVAPVIDVARVLSMLPPPPVNVARIPSPTRAIPISPSRSSGWRGTGGAAGWRIAAAALLMVGTLGVLVTRGGHWPATEAVLTTGVSASSTGTGDSALLADQSGHGSAASRPVLSLTGGLSDLSDDALDALLLEVDAIEALPLIEPPAMGAFSITEQTGAE